MIIRFLKKNFYLKYFISSEYYYPSNLKIKDVLFSHFNFIQEIKDLNQNINIFKIFFKTTNKDAIEFPNEKNKNLS